VGIRRDFRLLNAPGVKEMNECIFNFLTRLKPGAIPLKCGFNPIKVQCQRYWNGESIDLDAAKVDAAAAAGVQWKAVMWRGIGPLI
jgi:hypothetical protein